MNGIAKRRVGFLFNHRPDEVWHAAPIAFELSRIDPAIEVLILCADKENYSAVEQIASWYPDQNCRIEITRVPQLIRTFAHRLRGIAPLLKEIVLSDGARRFAGFDALVVPDLGSLKLRRRLNNISMFRVRHGAGDRSTIIDPRNAAFDYLLLPGPKYERRLRNSNLLHEGRYAVIGYPKFDAVDKLGFTPLRIFDNDRPVVLYTPHFENSFSSWRSWGPKVLDFFSRNEDQFNLIFAPHIKLFEQWLRRRAFLPRRFRNCPNIYIDLGSAASADMTYTNAADVYLGDVSSQVYEFLRRPRPCLFLNSHGVDWESDPDYACWHLGRVVNDLTELGPALEQAVSDHSGYKQAQERAFIDTFALTDTPSSARAAYAILDFISR